MRYKKQEALEKAEKLFKLARYLDMKRELQKLAEKYLDMKPKKRDVPKIDYGNFPPCRRG